MKIKSHIRGSKIPAKEIRQSVGMLKFYTALNNVDRNDYFCLDKYYVFIFICKYIHTV